MAVAQPVLALSLEYSVVTVASLAFPVLPLAVGHLETHQGKA